MTMPPGYDAWKLRSDRDDDWWNEAETEAEEEPDMEPRADEKMSDYLARFAGKLADAALTARSRGDEVHAVFFAIKAGEILSLAKTLGFDPPLEDHQSGR